MNIGKRFSIFLSIIFVLLSSGCTVQKTEGQLYNEKVIEKAKEIDQKLKVSGYTKATITRELLGIYCSDIKTIPMYFDILGSNGEILNKEIYDRLNVESGIIVDQNLAPYQPLVQNQQKITADFWLFSCRENNSETLYKEAIKIYDFTNYGVYEAENNNKVLGQKVIPFKNHRDSINIPEMEAKQQHPRFAIFGDNYGTKFVSRDNYFKSNTNYDQKEKDKYEAEKKFWFIVDVFMQLDLPSE